MDNYLLLSPSLEVEQLSARLGFAKTLFLGRDFVLVSGTPKDILIKTKEAKKKKLMVICRCNDEKILRFVLEKVPVDVILGMESIFRKDSLHYPKSGLDHILSKIAFEQGKAVGFSFSALLHAADAGKILNRMKFNLKLCRKYKLQVIFSNFSLAQAEIRSAKDLEAAFRVLSKRK
jgi:RNase P/RNase MRP subunit p30